MSGNQNKPTVEITFPSASSPDLADEFRFIDGGEISPSISFDFGDSDGDQISGIQIQVFVGEDLIWDSYETKLQGADAIFGSNLFAQLGPEDMVIPAEAGLQTGYIYGVKARVRDNYSDGDYPERWRLMSEWSTMKYFKIYGERKIKIKTT